MLKNNRWKLIVSSAIILLPVVFGLVFWNELPDHMTELPQNIRTAQKAPE